MAFGGKKWMLEWSRNKTMAEKDTEYNENRHFYNRVLQILSENW
jgi:hypothetical protein